MAEHLVERIVGVSQLSLRASGVGVPAQVQRQLLDLTRERREPCHLALRKQAPLVVQRPRPAQFGMHAAVFGAPPRMPLENDFGEHLDLRGIG